MAVNSDGTLFASVDSKQQCVRIYSQGREGQRTADPFVFGTRGQLDGPRFLCFVHRNGTDTLLICDLGNDRVVEVSSSGVFLRAIAVKPGSRPFGVAYCGSSEVIAVSLCCAATVVLMDYESGRAKPEATIGFGTAGSDDGQLHYPTGLAFTTDGLHLLVADFYNHRVSKFSAASGAFIAHVATNAENGISYPRDVLQCEEGIIVVAQGRPHVASSLVCVGADAVTVQKIIIPTITSLLSLSHSPSLSGVIVNTSEGSVFLVRDAWTASSRSAWLSALSFK
jgi:hypothetical protein